MVALEFHSTGPNNLHRSHTHETGPLYPPSSPHRETPLSSLWNKPVSIALLSSASSSPASRKVRQIKWFQGPFAFKQLMVLNIVPWKHTIYFSVSQVRNNKKGTRLWILLEYESIRWITRNLFEHIYKLTQCSQPLIPYILPTAISKNPSPTRMKIKRSLFPRKTFICFLAFSYYRLITRCKFQGH